MSPHFGMPGRVQSLHMGREGGKREGRRREVEEGEGRRRERREVENGEGRRRERRGG